MTTVTRKPRAATEPEPRLTRAFTEQRAFLFGLCYRMTGSAADAEDMLQDTFVRALRSPPEDLETSLRPWLARIAVNLCCDHLRRRKQRKYRGTWLPEPLPTAELRGGEPAAAASSDARYDLLESATYAFLIALEALTPSQRAVLLLRDVFDYSVRDTAQALSLSEANVKTTLHRARAAMLAYDQRRCKPTPALRKQTERVLRRFVTHLMTDDVRAIEALLREDVVELNDPGEFVAAGKPILGRDKVVFFNRKLTLLTSHDPRFAFADLNGMPALILEYTPERTDFAPRALFRIELDERGRIRELHVIVASQKLKRLRFEGLRRPSWLEQLTVAGLRKLVARRPTTARKPSRHVQVHPRSRARR